MSSLARATANGVKTRATPMDDLQGVAEMFQTPPTVQINEESSRKVQKAGNWLSSLAKATNGPRRRGTPVEDLVGVSEMFATPPCVNKLEKTSDESAVTESTGEQELNVIAALKPTTTPSLRRSGKDKAAVKVATLVHTPPPSLLEIVQPLALSKTPSLRHAAQEVMSLQVVSPVQVSRTPSLRSAKKQSSVLTNESPDLHLEFSVPPIEPSKTPSMRSSDDVKVVSRKSVGNPRNNRQSLGLQGLKRLVKSPKQNNAVENCEELFVPGMFASPKPQPKRYSRKSEGLQGVARLLGTPLNKDKTAATMSPKLDGIKAMMQPKELTSPNFVGLRVLMKTPKSSGTVDPEEHFSSEIFASTEGDLSSERDRSSRIISVPVIDLTSPESQENAVNKNVDSTSRITRAKRSAPKGLTAPLPKRARRTRSTGNQQDEDKLETCSKPKLTQKKTTSRSKKNPAVTAQTTPKPFVFKRTQLDPIIEVPSPLSSFNNSIKSNTSSSSINTEEDKTWQGQRRTRSTTQTNTETIPPLQRSAGRGKRAQSETVVSSESIRVDVRKNRSAKKNNRTVEGKDVGAEEEVEQPKVVKTRSTRSSQVQEAPSLDCTSLVYKEAPSTGKTRATRSHSTDGSHAEKHVHKSDITNAPRRSRRGTKTVEENVTVSEDTKSTRKTSGKALSSVPPRKTRSSHALEEDGKVQPDSSVLEETKVTRSSVKKNDNSQTTKRNTRSSQVEKITPEKNRKVQSENVVVEETKSTRKTRSSRAVTVAPEEDKVEQERSAVTVPPKHQMKGEASFEPKKTRSTRNSKPAEKEKDEGKISLLTTRGTKRRLEEVTSISPVPEPKRTTRSSARIQTRSGSRK